MDRVAEAHRLLEFAAGSVTDGGFGWLDERGGVLARPLELWINARMTYVFASAGQTGLARHGVDALLTTFRDAEHGGWFRAQDDDTKACYEHAFVVLAGCAAADAGVPGGDRLAEEAMALHVERFWDDDAGRCREEWSRDWSVLDDYRGANSNMHTVEAYLAAAATTGDGVWLDRATSILTRVLAVAAEHGHRVVEHFAPDWTPLPELNRDRPRDPFRPYGATPGHGFEWARLAVQLDAARGARPGADLRATAEALFDRAVADTGGGVTGFCYTTDWDGVPVATERFHWVVCEAILAADALGRHDLRDRWWRLADEHFVDHDGGSWWHERSADLGPSSSTWVGKPDVYHAYNACTLSPAT